MSDDIEESEIRRIAREEALDVAGLEAKDPDGEAWSIRKLMSQFEVDRRTALQAMGLIALGYAAPRAVLSTISGTAEAAPDDNLTVPGTLDADAVSTDEINNVVYVSKATESALQSAIDNASGQTKIVGPGEQITISTGLTVGQSIQLDLSGTPLKVDGSLTSPLIEFDTSDGANRDVVHDFGLIKGKSVATGAPLIRLDNADRHTLRGIRALNAATTFVEMQSSSLSDGNVHSRLIDCVAFGTGESGSIGVNVQNGSNDAVLDTVAVTDFDTGYRVTGGWCYFGGGRALGCTNNYDLRGPSIYGAVQSENAGEHGVLLNGCTSGEFSIVDLSSGTDSNDTYAAVKNQGSSRNMIINVASRNTSTPSAAYAVEDTASSGNIAYNIGVDPNNLPQTAAENITNPDASFRVSESGGVRERIKELENAGSPIQVSDSLQTESVSDGTSRTGFSWDLATSNAASRTRSQHTADVGGTGKNIIELFDEGVSGGLVVVLGRDQSNSQSFIDLQLCSKTQGISNLGSVASGSAASRSYSQSGSHLQLSLSSGTYQVSAFGVSLGVPT